MSRAVVIGAGAIAKEHLGALRATPHAEPVGVCDLSAAMAESTAERFGVEAWGTDYHEMLERLKPDAVHVTTPAPTHAMIARDALDAGAHVLVEKPITPTFADFQELADLGGVQGLCVGSWKTTTISSTGTCGSLLAGPRRGRLGEVRHVEVQINLGLFGPGSRFADADCPHPAMREPLGAASDFLTHLAYLAVAFVGAHRKVSTLANPTDDSPDAPQAISEFKHAHQRRAWHGVALGSAPARRSTASGSASRGRSGGPRSTCSRSARQPPTALSGPGPLVPIRNMLAPRP